MFKFIIVAFFLLLQVEANTDEALKAFKAQQYQKAFELYVKSAFAG